MPYTSERQRRFFHTSTARAKGITPEMAAEYDAATKGRALPKTAQLHASFVDFCAHDWHVGFLKHAAFLGIRLPKLPSGPQLATVGQTPGLPKAKNLGKKVQELGQTQSFSAATRAFGQQRTLPVGSNT